MIDSVVKVVESALKSTHLPTKLSALHGGLYILETGVTDVSLHLVPLLGDHVLRSLACITPYDIILFVCYTFMSVIALNCFVYVSVIFCCCGHESI